MSQTRQQIIAIPILPNISRSKSDQAVKFSELKYITSEIFFFKNYSENETWRLVQDLFLFFKKTLCKVKASGQHLSFNMFC